MFTPARPRRPPLAVCAALLWLACAPRVPDPTPTAPPPGATLVPSEGTDADLARTRAFAATRPTYEQPLGFGLDVPAGVASNSADACGACHSEIQAEWQVSTHAAAWTDPQFQAEIQKSDNRWLCLNCHTPLLTQQDRWPIGVSDGDVERPLLVENQAFDAELRDEGITCSGCHVVDGVIHGPGLPDSTAPHAVVADTRFTDDQLCLRCHQATATYPGKSFVCTFDTGAEWAAGPYAQAGTGCADCHMPKVERPAANGGPVRTVARHWWRGAGIPKFAGIHPPAEANPPGLDLTATWTDAGLAVTATNARAGHRLPTGDPERWVQMDVRWLDAGGAPVGEPWSARFGQTWEWYPEARKVADDRLAPNEARTWTLAPPPGATRARVEASSHRMTPETAAYHHLGDYPLSVQTHAIDVQPG